MLPFIIVLYNASFKCKHKSICRVTKITQFIFHSSYMCMHFILTETAEMPHKTDQTVYISLYVHILPTVSYLQLTNE